MNEQKQIQLEPNAHFVSGITIASTEEEFILHIISGHTARNYTLTPKHAKRVLMLLQKTVSDYESKFGELTTKLPEAPNQTQSKKIGFSTEEDKKGI